MRGKHTKLGEGSGRLGQDSLPNIAISVAESRYVVLPAPFMVSAINQSFFLRCLGFKCVTVVNCTSSSVVLPLKHYCDASVAVTLKFAEYLLRP